MMLRNFVQYLFLLILLLSGVSLGAAEHNPYIFSSPKGKFIVHLIELENIIFSKEDSIKSTDNVNHARYQLVVFNQAGKEVVKSIYYDVYGWQLNAKKTDPVIISSWFAWSPNEDFVFLPVEGWASAPGTSSQVAYNLNPKHLWKKSIVEIDDQVWINSLVLVGNRNEDCDYSVVKFDGVTGITQILRKSVNVYSYEIVHVDKNAFITKVVINNCGSDRDYENFSPGCEIWNRATLTSKNIACSIIKKAR